MAAKYNLPPTVAGNIVDWLASTGTTVEGANPSSALSSVRLHVRTRREGSTRVVVLESPYDITITDSATWAWSARAFQAPIKPGTYYYDLEMTDASGTIRTRVGGEWEITKPRTSIQKDVWSAWTEATPDVDLFSDYSAQTWSTTCWAKDWDLSGVSWEGTGADGDERRVALIGRNCWTSAYHFRPSVGDTRTFTDKFGSTFTYTIDAASGAEVYGDVIVGTFSAPVSATLPSYGIAEDLVLGEYMVATRSRPSLAVRYPTTQRAVLEKVTVLNTVVTFRTREYAPIEAYEDMWLANTGDSGDPLFAVRGSTLKLAGHYWMTTAAPFLGYPDAISDIDTWLSANGGVRLEQAATAP